VQDCSAVIELGHLGDAAAAAVPGDVLIPAQIVSFHEDALAPKKISDCETSSASMNAVHARMDVGLCGVHGYS